MVLLCTHDKTYRVSPVGFMSIAFFFLLEQTDVLKQTHSVITDNQVAETLWY
jgi:TRAP-type C4-dicarboxylate transport system permease small subunit